jgi:hypothetical protein
MKLKTQMQGQKNWWLVVCSLFFIHPLFSQSKGFSISASVNLPLGEFSSTHLGGIGLGYAPAIHGFRMVQRDSLLLKKKTAFHYNGGLAYYPGKNETVSGHDYKYPGYLFIHAFAGVLYVPVSKAEIKLTAGPAIGIYNGNTRFNVGSKLEASYYINTRISAGPAIIMMKEFGSDPLWAGSLKIAMDF